MCRKECTACVEHLYYMEGVGTCVEKGCPKSTTQKGESKVCTKD